MRNGEYKRGDKLWLLSQHLIVCITYRELTTTRALEPQKFVGWQTTGLVGFFQTYVKDFYQLSLRAWVGLGSLRAWTGFELHLF